MTTPARGGRKARAGLVVHRSPLHDDDVDELEGGLRVTSVARTCLDCAGVLSASALDALLERCELVRVYDRRALEAAIGRATGRPEAASLAAAMERYDPRRVAARSGLERRFVGLCAGDGIDDGLELNAWAEGFELDISFPAERIVIELDGAAFHLTRGQKRRDLRRDAELERRGWRSVRFLDEDVDGRPRWVLDVVRDLRGRPRS